MLDAMYETGPSMMVFCLIILLMVSYEGRAKLRPDLERRSLLLGYFIIAGRLIFV